MWRPGSALRLCVASGLNPRRLGTIPSLRSACLNCDRLKVLPIHHPRAAPFGTVGRVESARLKLHGLNAPIPVLRLEGLPRLTTRDHRSPMIENRR